MGVSAAGGLAMSNRVSKCSVLLVTLILCLSTARLWGVDQDFKVKGILVDASCIKRQGTGKVLSAEHVTCAKECFSKGEQLGIFSEDSGLVKIVGSFPAKNSARVAALLGREVEVTGSRIRGGDYSTLIDVTTITLLKK
jgi:hypothetical protein